MDHCFAFPEYCVWRPPSSIFQQSKTRCDKTCISQVAGTLFSHLDLKSSNTILYTQADGTLFCVSRILRLAAAKLNMSTIEKCVAKRHVFPRSQAPDIGHLIKIINSDLAYASGWNTVLLFQDIASGGRQTQYVDIPANTKSRKSIKIFPFPRVGNVGVWKNFRFPELGKFSLEIFSEIILKRFPRDKISSPSGGRVVKRL